MKTTASAGVAKETLRLTRSESDSVGTKEVPIHALYGVQTMRAYENFPMTGRKLHPAFINALAQVKKACALANYEAKTISLEKKNAIVKACDDIISGRYHDAFITDPIQGGAGTSMNMNANEVIANLAILNLGGREGEYSLVHPNDDVNKGQSTNDVIPTAGKVAALFILNDMEKSMQKLISAFETKAEEFDGILKMGRTQLQDAVPIRLGQEFDAYAHALQRGLDRIRRTKKELHQINLGGTAIGTCINADREYYFRVCQKLSEVTGESFEHCDDLIDGTMNPDSFLAVLDSVKTCAVVLSKIANDLRLMSSGPKTGLHEIELQAMQNGSSIMPGKINPVIPEVVSQCAFKIMGNDQTVSLAVEAGQLELNAFEPVIFDCLFESIDLLKNAAETFRIHCIEGIKADEKRCASLLRSSVGIVTALNPYIGYEKSAALAKRALHENIDIVTLIRQEKILTDDQLRTILNPYRMTKLEEDRN